MITWFISSLKILGKHRILRVAKQLGFKEGSFGDLSPGSPWSCHSNNSAAQTSLYLSAQVPGSWKGEPDHCDLGLVSLPRITQPWEIGQKTPQRKLLWYGQLPWLCLPHLVCSRVASFVGVGLMLVHIAYTILGKYITLLSRCFFFLITKERSLRSYY